MDDADRAQAHVEADLERRIQAARQITTGFAATPTARYCDMCGSEIDPKRRDAIPGVRQCFDCARDLEQYARRVL